MALQMLSVPITINPSSGDTLSGQGTADFGGAVIHAEAALQGFDITFDNGDHHLLEEKIIAFVVNTQVGHVTVQVDLLLRDGSGNVDDPFSGFFNVLVLADVA